MLIGLDHHTPGIQLWTGQLNTEKKGLRTKTFKYILIFYGIPKCLLSLITCNFVVLTMFAVDQNQRLSCEMFVTKSNSFTFSYKYLK